MQGRLGWCPEMQLGYPDKGDDDHYPAEIMIARWLEDPEGCE